MVITILEATVAPDRAADLHAAFRGAAREIPPGFIRSHLVSAVADPTRWRIETLWTSREALAAMRQAGTPAGVLMFRAAGAEPSLNLYEVESTIEAKESDTIGREAAITNPKLLPFQPLIGTWKTTGHHPMVPGKTFHGRTSFAWQDGGAFLVMRSETDEPEIPSGIAIISGDDSSDLLTMLYFDERGVSRRYDIKMEGNTATWSRNSPEISQRCTVTVSEDGKTMQTKAEFSKDNGPWGPDLELTYTRIA